MLRLALVSCLIFSSVFAVAQTTPQTTSDAFAILLAQKSVVALTGGNPVSDVTLNANLTSIIGADYETGTATFQAKGMDESRVDLNLSNGGTRSDVRNVASGSPSGAWGTNGSPSTSYASHNCWTDAAWFFPALTSLAQSANQNFVFKYIGQEQHGGVNTQHVRSYQLPPSGFKNSPISSLTTMDFYLDAVSLLPIALGFNAHPDNAMETNLPVEINFANYRPVNGVQVAFHFQKVFNGLVVLDVTVSSAAFNSGLAEALFTLQ
jgi:hypothetical protein